MKWKDLGKIIVEHAPIIGVALGGPAGGSVGQIISSVLGVEEKPEAILSKLKEDPINYVKVLEIQKTHELEILRATNAAHAADQSIFADIYKAELKSESWMARNWRPMFGMSVAISFSIQMLGVTAVMLLSPKDANDVINGMITLIPIWGVALSVLGINIDRRSEDKRVEASVKQGQNVPSRQPRGLAAILSGVLSKGKQDDSTT